MLIVVYSLTSCVYSWRPRWVLLLKSYLPLSPDLLLMRTRFPTRLLLRLPSSLTKLSIHHITKQTTRADHLGGGLGGYQLLTLSLFLIIIIILEISFSLLSTLHFFILLLSRVSPSLTQISHSQALPQHLYLSSSSPSPSFLHSFTPPPPSSSSSSFLSFGSWIRSLFTLPDHSTDSHPWNDAIKVPTGAQSVMLTHAKPPQRAQSSTERWPTGKSDGGEGWRLKKKGEGGGGQEFHVLNCRRNKMFQTGFDWSVMSKTNDEGILSKFTFSISWWEKRIAWQTWWCASRWSRNVGRQVLLSRDSFYTSKMIGAKVRFFTSKHYALYVFMCSAVINEAKQHSSNCSSSND